MSIIIKQGVSAWRKKPTAEQGFTLIEVIVVLAIFSLLLGCLTQGAVIAVQSQANSLEKQQVIYLVQQIYTRQEIENIEDLTYSIVERDYSEKLVEKIVQIENNKGKHWTFYYLQEKMYE